MLGSEPARANCRPHCARAYEIVQQHCAARLAEIEASGPHAEGSVRRTEQKMLLSAPHDVTSLMRRLAQSATDPSLYRVIDEATRSFIAADAVDQRLGQNCSSAARAGLHLLRTLHNQFPRYFAQIIMQTIELPELGRRGRLTPDSDAGEHHATAPVCTLTELRALGSDAEAVLGHRFAAGARQYLVQPAQVQNAWPSIHQAPQLIYTLVQSTKRARSGEDATLRLGPCWITLTEPETLPLIDVYNAHKIHTPEDRSVRCLGPSPKCASTCIETNSINPDRDAVDTFGPAYVAGDAGAIHMYGLYGRFAGTITTGQMHHLWQLYHSAGAERTPRQFALAVCDLLRRQAKQNRDRGGRGDAWRNPLTPTARARIIDAYDLHVDMFSDPLTAQPGLAFHSDAGADALFGAYPPALTGTWAGRVLFSPPKGSEQREALLHASSCARAHRNSAQPFLAIGIVPYAQVNIREFAMADSRTRILGTIPSASAHADPASGRLRKLLITATANPAGMATLEGLPHDTTALLLASLGGQLPNCATARHAATDAYLKRALWRTQLREAARNRAFSEAAPDGTPAPPLPPAAPIPQLRFAGQRITFTDASVLESQNGTGCGCGIHIPPSPLQHERQTRSGTAQTHGFAFTGTITRGELLSLLAALRLGNEAGRAAQQGDLHIATDSMTSLHLIRSIMHVPHRLEHQQHQHLHLLRAIRLEIEQRAGRTCLYHTRAHVGTAGNEAADAAAKAAARGHTTCELAAVPREGRDLRALKRAFLENAERAAVMAATTTAGKQLSLAYPGSRRPLYCGRALPAHYYEFDTAASTAFRRTKGARRRAATANRLGCFVAGNPTAACPLCGQPGYDNNHLLGSCVHAAIKRIQTRYHNKAVGLVVDSIRRGEYGGFAITADAANQKASRIEGAESGAPNHNTIGDLLPGYPGKPDICLIRGHLQSQFDCGDDERGAPLRHWPEPDRQYTVMCLELTFTNGKKLHEAIHRKQHKYTPSATDTPEPRAELFGAGGDAQPHLLSALRERGYSALGERDDTLADGLPVLHPSGDRMPTLAIGHCGALLRHYNQMLQDFGLSGAEATALLRALNLLAARRAAAISKKARRLISKKERKARERAAAEASGSSPPYTSDSSDSSESDGDDAPARRRAQPRRRPLSRGPPATRTEPAPRPSPRARAERMLATAKAFALKARERNKLQRAQEAAATVSGEIPHAESSRAGEARAAKAQQRQLPPRGASPAQATTAGAAQPSAPAETTGTIQPTTRAEAGAALWRPTEINPTLRRKQRTRRRGASPTPPPAHRPRRLPAARAAQLTRTKRNRDPSSDSDQSAPQPHPKRANLRACDSIQPPARFRAAPNPVPYPLRPRRQTGPDRHPSANDHPP